MRGCRGPELDRSDLSAWQGRTHALAPCPCGAPGGGDDRAGGSSWQVKHGEQINKDKCRKIHATGSGPSGLGMMHPEGRPQQGKLKT